MTEKPDDALPGYLQPGNKENKENESGNLLDFEKEKEQKNEQKPEDKEQKKSNLEEAAKSLSKNEVITNYKYGIEKIRAEKKIRREKIKGKLDESVDFHYQILDWLGFDTYNLRYGKSKKETQKILDELSSTKAKLTVEYEDFLDKYIQIEMDKYNYAIKMKETVKIHNNFCDLYSELDSRKSQVAKKGGKDLSNLVRDMSMCRIKIDKTKNDVEMYTKYLKQAENQSINIDNHLRQYEYELAAIDLAIAEAEYKLSQLELSSSNINLLESVACQFHKLEKALKGVSKLIIKNDNHNLRIGWKSEEGYENSKSEEPYEPKKLELTQDQKLLLEKYDLKD